MSDRLHKPDPDQDFDEFPYIETSADSVLFRAHQSVQPNPWFFASHPNGRFNLDHPMGTCYAADDRKTALLEVIRERHLSGKTALRSVVEPYSVTEVTLAAGFVAAALDDEDATDFGAHRSVSVEDDYEITRVWARRFYDEDFDGIHYESAFTSAGGANAWAIFGISGPAAQSDERYGDSTSAVTALEELGYTVVDDTSDKLTDIGLDVKPKGFEL